MLKKFKRYSFWLTLSSLFIFQTGVLGQDLGSSSGIFRSSNPSAKSSSTTKKESPKPKSATAKSEPVKKKSIKASDRNTSRSNNSAKTNKDSNKSKVEISKSAPTTTTANQQLQNNIVITAGQKTSGDYNELFEQAIDEGNTARDDRNYFSAEKAYRRALSLKPKDSRAIYGLGNLYSDQQRWEEAERAYRQAIQLEPNSPEAYIALSFVLSQPIVGTNFERYAEAEKMAQKSVQLDPNNAVGYDQLGVSLELQGKIGDETQRAYQKAIQLDAGFALAYAHLGRLLRRKGLVNESSAAYRDAVRLATDVPTMILVADVMQSQQRFIESEQLLRRALREDPKNPTALFLLGRALTTRGSFDEAEKVLKTSVDVSPNSFVSYASLGSLYVRRNKFEDAEKILMRAIQVISANERRRLSQEFEFVGDGYMKIGKGKDAARLYRQALSLDGDKSLLTNKLNKAQKS